MTLETFSDGNAIGGPLADLFTVDLTAASTVCCGCGRDGAVATLRVYGGGPGLVARCPGCDAVVMRFARFDGRVVLDLRGTVRLTVPLPTPR